MRDRPTVDDYVGWIAGGGLALYAVALGVVLASAPVPPIRKDSAFYEHAGWYVTQGAVPYVDLWDPKPPLNFEYAALVAWVFGSDPTVLHAAHLLFTAAALVGSMVLVGRLVFRLTGDAVAAAVGGFTMAALPGWLYFAAQGYRPKYGTVLFGLLAVELAFRRRYVASGVAAALGAGFWQGGAVFALLAVGLGWQTASATGDGDRPGTSPGGAVARCLAGGLLTTVAVLAPMVHLGAEHAMLAEVLLAPALASEQLSPVYKLFVGLSLFKYGSLAVVAGVGLGSWALLREPRRTWWVLLGGALSAYGVFFVDLDGPPDLFVGLSFLAVATGVGFARLGPAHRRVGVVALGLVVVVNAAAAGGVGLVFEPAYPVTTLDETLPQPEAHPVESDVEVTRRTEVPRYHSTGYMPTLYWERATPETCRYRVGGMHKAWIAALNASLDDRTCGTVPPGRRPGWFDRLNRSV